MKHNMRIAIRLPETQREKINELVTKGKFKNISQVVRSALDEFFKE